jgi:hypothetical protein
VFLAALGVALALGLYLLAHLLDRSLLITLGVALALGLYLLAHWWNLSRSAITVHVTIAMIGAVGSGVGVALGTLPAVQEALSCLGLFSYVFLAALGGALAMGLSLSLTSTLTRKL